MANVPVGSPTSWDWSKVSQADMVETEPPAKLTAWPLVLGTDVPHDTPTGVGFSAYPIVLGTDTNSSIPNLTVTTKLIVSPQGAAPPTADASREGQIYIQDGGGTAKSKAFICMQAVGTNVYQWVQIGIST